MSDDLVQPSRRRPAPSRPDRPMELEPIKSTRIYEEIVRQIKTMITEGRLKSGDPEEKVIALNQLVIENDGGA